MVSYLFQYINKPNLKYIGKDIYNYFLFGNWNTNEGVKKV